MISTDGIRATGLYLLETLVHEKAVLYSRFYGNDSEIEDNLVRGVRPFLDDDEYDEKSFREHAYVMLEFAAWQLEDLGLVRISFLKALLIDGHPDFQITLTKEGEDAAVEGLTFDFHRPDYQINASPASEWLIVLLGTPGSETTNLREVMRSADSDGEVRIIDDSGNDYGLGTGTFAWAFEVSLWHHAQRGVIVPACRSTEDEQIWSDFVKTRGRPKPPSPFAHRLVWDIPFRLADVFVNSTATVEHVGLVS